MAEDDKTPQSARVTPPEPGQVIAPGAVQPPAARQPAPANGPAAESTRPAGEPASSAAFEPDGLAQDSTISWTASEYIAHEKSAGWYLVLAIVAVIIAAAVYLLTKDKVSTAVVLVGALALGVMGGKKPRQLQYQLDATGVVIGQKRFPYEMFRSFSVVPEGAFSSIVFVPLKRFAPLTTIYYAPDDEDKILDALASRLPFEERKADAVDSLMRRVRF